MSPTRMKFALAILAAGLLSGCAGVEVPPQMRFVKAVPLGAPDRWDYLAVDPDSHRVFVAHGTEVTVLDGQSGAVIARIAGLDTAHGIALAPGQERGAIANDGHATAFDLASLARLADIPTGAGADAAVYDPASARVFVANGKAGTLTAIDPHSNAEVGAIALGGKPGAIAVDGGGKLFVSIEDSGAIARIDTASLKIDARWTLAGCESPHGLSIDTEGRRLFAGCANSVLMVVGADDGAVVARLPIGRGGDTVAFDPRRKLIFSANGEGTLSVYGIGAADYYVDQGTVPTGPGARAMALDAVTGRVFLVTADIDPAAPPGPRPDFVPGTVKLLVMDPP